MLRTDEDKLFYLTSVENEMLFVFKVSGWFSMVFATSEFLSNFELMTLYKITIPPAISNIITKTKTIIAIVMFLSYLLIASYCCFMTEA